MMLKLLTLMMVAAAALAYVRSSFRQAVTSASEGANVSFRTLVLIYTILESTYVISLIVIIGISIKLLQLIIRAL